MNAQEAMAVVEAMRSSTKAKHRAVLVEYLPEDSPVLAELAKDKDYWVRVTVARRLPVDSPVLAELAKAENIGVRRAAEVRLKEKA